MRRQGGALLVCGATSGAGKSTVTAALCRSWVRQGMQVAPFKAQNMSNHAAVTSDGGEVGRAQAMQAAAARVALDRRMNPILLKPSAGHRSHVVVLGNEVSTTDAVTYGPTSVELRPVVLDAFTSLRSDYDWVIAEGAGGAAEINLLDRDLVNLPLACAAGMPAVLVVDIDRGGAFAAAHGTVDLLPAPMREAVVGIVFNQFRGDASLLDSGIIELERRCGVPVLGVLPHLGDHRMLGVEDSLDIHTNWHAMTRSPRPVRVAAIRLPHLANPSDLDPLVVEPDVELRWVTRPGELDAADLIVIPGSRATVADLQWLRHTGLGAAVEQANAWVLGICAGYQMLGRTIDDNVESMTGMVEGFGLLDASTTFERSKIVRTSHGVAGENVVDGYQIRHGRVTSNEQPWFFLDGANEGAVSPSGTIYGTSLHGLFDADGFRIQLLHAVANAQGRSYQAAPATFASVLDAHHDHLADWVETHLDSSRLVELAATAAHPQEAPGW